MGPSDEYDSKYNTGDIGISQPGRDSKNFPSYNQPNNRNDRNYESNRNYENVRSYGKDRNYGSDRNYENVRSYGNDRRYGNDKNDGNTYYNDYRQKQFNEYEE